jgi:protease-4
LQAYSQRVADDATWHFQAATSDVQRREGKLYSQVDDIALIRIVDQMSKAPSSMGGTSTILTRRAIRQALADEEITSLLLAIDSPGGMVAGTMELAEEVRRASEKKPVSAHIEDLGASAAYWVASQAQRITATVITQVGSIGVLAEVWDESGVAEKMGLKVHVVSTGPYKGLGAPGTPVTDELLQEVDAIVQGIGAQFFRDVQQGRKLSNPRLAAVTTGQVWLAPQALELGLIDGIESFEQALEAAGKMRRRRGRSERSVRVAEAIAAVRARLVERDVSATDGQEGQED